MVRIQSRKTEYIFKLNAAEKSITFTIEFERTINFLDTLISNNRDTVEMTVHLKMTQK